MTIEHHGYRTADSRTLTAVAAYSKNGKRPEDHRARSLLRPSTFENDVRIGQCMPMEKTCSQDSENVRVHFQGSLVDASGQGGIQTLCQSLRYYQLARYIFELRVGLESLDDMKMSGYDT